MSHAIIGVQSAGWPGEIDQLSQAANGPQPQQNRWLTLLPHGIAWIALLFAFDELYTFGTRYGFSTGVEYWLFRPNDNAPPVILGVSAWLAYRRSHRIRALPWSVGPAWAIGLCGLVGLGIFYWSVYTQAYDLQIFSMIFLFSGVILTYWGPAGLRVLWLPLAVLLFAIPLPAPLLLAIIFKLQIWTAQLAGLILYGFGVPALVSGDQILRATQAFQVIEGCSGMRSIQILTLLTILLVDLFQRRGRHAMILIIVAPALAFLLNGFRVVTLILNPHSEIIAIHNLQGIVILLLGLLTIYLLDSILETFSSLNPQEASMMHTGAQGSPGVPRAGFVVAGTIALIANTLLYTTTAWSAPGTGEETLTLRAAVAETLDGWPSEKLEPDFQFRGSARFGDVVKRRYFLEMGRVSVFLAESDFGQRGGSPLSETTAHPGSGWVVRSETVEERPDGTKLRVRIVEKGKHRLLLYHWETGSKGLLIESLRSLLALDRSPLRRPEPILVTRLSTPLVDRRERSLEAARLRLDAVETRLAPGLEALRSRGNV